VRRGAAAGGSGAMPPPIAMLANLKTLDLSFAQITDDG